jgi:hypothetical protein
MSANKIKAHIRTDQPENYAATDPAGYYYMFTGGYGYNNGNLSQNPVGDDDGPAGEIKLTDSSGSWEIDVQDHTNKKFKIVRWDMAEENIPGATFDPPANADLATPVDKLTITASNIPTGHNGDYDGYTITVVDENGNRVELDPRIYDDRN